MTADPHIETASRKRADRRKRASWVLGPMVKSGYAPRKAELARWVVEATRESDALAARLEAAERDNERLRLERREAVGLALWVAAIESQPIESRVAWVEEMVKRYRVVRVQRRAALAAALAGREGTRADEECERCDGNGIGGLSCPDCGRPPAGREGSDDAPKPAGFPHVDPCACGHDHTVGREGVCGTFLCDCREWRAPKREGGSDDR